MGTTVEIASLRSIINDLQRRVYALEHAPRLTSASLHRGTLTILDDDKDPLARLGVLPDNRVAQAFYDPDGNELIRLGEQSDGRFAQTFYDASGNELIRLGEQSDGRFGQDVFNPAGNRLLRSGQLADGDVGMAVFNTSGVEQARFNAQGVSVVRSGVRTNLADYIFGEQHQHISDFETTTSATFTDLATVGPSVTVVVGPSGRVRLTGGASAEADTAAGGYGAEISFVASGANTIGDTVLTWLFATAGSSIGGGISSGRILSGLAPGPTTFRLRYRKVFSATQAGFRDRWLTVQPL